MTLTLPLVLSPPRAAADNRTTQRLLDQVAAIEMRTGLMILADRSPVVIQSLGRADREALASAMERLEWLTRSRQVSSKSEVYYLLTTALQDARDGRRVDSSRWLCDLRVSARRSKFRFRVFSDELAKLACADYRENYVEERDEDCHDAPCLSGNYYGGNPRDISVWRTDWIHKRDCAGKQTVRYENGVRKEIVRSCSLAFGRR